MKSVMAHQFSQVPQAEIVRSSFDRSHGIKTTFDAGYLVPIYVDEVLPGDTFNLNLTGFARLATPIKPIMDNLYMETFFFYVPNRIMFDQWKRLQGEQLSPTDNIVGIESPKLDILQGQATSQSIYDYMGLPIYAPGDIRVNSFPLRAYNMIWNEWFRDQNLQDPVDENKGGLDSFSHYNLLRRGKRHDYFTSCLPFPQKGDEVTIPTLTTATVVPSGDGTPSLGVTVGEPRFLTASTGAADLNLSGIVATGGNLQWVNPRLEVDLAEATAVSINNLRVAFQWQKMLEKDARGGTRYTEMIRSHFGVTSPDARLQRPEFLGGGSSRVNISPVQQTSISGGETPQGNLAAFGTAQLHNHGFTKSFTEHGIILGLVNVRADLTYQQGCARMWLRNTRFDYFMPSLAFIGEQEVYNFEIVSHTNIDPATDTIIGAIQPDGIAPNAVPAHVFGYQERWAEYRYKPSQITGKFRSDDPASLDVWHLSQDFELLIPALNSEFIEDDPPISRVIAIPTEPQFLFDAHIQLRCARPMPLYGVPGNVDRF